jgi:dTDP-4-dehydrorhamnose reductase
MKIEFNEKFSVFNKKTILLTGTKGMLGASFEDIIKKESPDCKLISTSREQMDITDEEQVLSYADTQIDIIIHCAAKVDAEFCENNPQESSKRIIRGTENIVNLASKTNAKIFYPQSFLIFDGESIPITEKTIPVPLCKYGRDKLSAEENILKNCNNSLIVRMGGFFGGYNKDKNFVGKIIPHLSMLIKKGEKEISVGDRIWQPTYTKDLAYNSLILLSENKNGTYNMASHGQVSFYDLTTKIVSLLEIEDKINIRQISSSSFTKKENARRPNIAVIENTRLKQESLDLQRKWDESLKEYLSHSYFRDLF